VILVGHSYAGMVLSAVAEEAAGRLDHLVYLDAFTPRNGESALDLEPPGTAEAFVELARTQGDGWRLPPQEAYLDRWGLKVEDRP
jgi:pimeloyl-ACP methyl ester carboxylesterase